MFITKNDFSEKTKLLHYANSSKHIFKYSVYMCYMSINT